MTISELVLVISCVVSILTMVLAFLVYKDTVSLKSSIKELQIGSIAILNKINSVEHLTNKLGSSFTEFINITDNVVDKMSGMTTGFRNGHVYKTTDGKYSATSIDELINKIKNANEETQYFSEDELDKLRNMFSSEDDDEDDDDFLNNEDR